MSIDVLLNGYALCDILIIDNNSTDNARDKIEKYVHRKIYLHLFLAEMRNVHRYVHKG